MTEPLALEYTGCEGLERVRPEPCKRTGLRPPVHKTFGSAAHKCGYHCGLYCPRIDRPSYSGPSTPAVQPAAAP